MCFIVFRKVTKRIFGHGIYSMPVEALPVPTWPWVHQLASNLAPFLWWQQETWWLLRCKRRGCRLLQLATRLTLRDHWLRRVFCLIICRLGFLNLTRGMSFLSCNRILLLRDTVLTCEYMGCIVFTLHYVVTIRHKIFFRKVVSFALSTSILGYLFTLILYVYFDHSQQDKKK